MYETYVYFLQYTGFTISPVIITLHYSLSIVKKNNIVPLDIQYHFRTLIQTVREVGYPAIAGDLHNVLLMLLSL